jgi:glucose-1-phosphate thymidylyltransferase
VRALVLAAGWATRLGALAADRPKHLLPVGRTTPLDQVVDRLDAVAALGRIDVVTHERFRPAFDAWWARRTTRATLALRSNGTRTPESRLGAVGDLARFLEQASPGEPLLVLGGDMLFDFALDAVAEVARREPVTAVYDVGSPGLVRRYASVSLDASGRVTRFREKDPRPRGTLAAPAIYGLPPDAQDDVGRYLAEGGARDNLGFLMQWWVGRRVVRGVRVRGSWIDVGSPDEYARAVREFGGAPR